MGSFYTPTERLHVNDQMLHYPNYLSVTQIALYLGDTLAALGGEGLSMTTEG